MSYWENKPSADEIAAELADRLRAESHPHFVDRLSVAGISNAAVALAGKAEEWCAIAYANGYKAALDDCEKADVGALIERVASLEGRLAFENAQRRIAERRHDELAARYATAKT